MRLSFLSVHASAARMGNAIQSEAVPNARANFILTEEQASWRSCVGVSVECLTWICAVSCKGNDSLAAYSLSSLKVLLEKSVESFGFQTKGSSRSTLTQAQSDAVWAAGILCGGRLREALALAPQQHFAT